MVRIVLTSKEFKNRASAHLRKPIRISKGALDEIKTRFEIEISNQLEAALPIMIAAAQKERRTTIKERDVSLAFSYKQRLW